MREMIAAFRKAGHTVLPIIAGGTTPEEEIRPAPENSIRTVLKKFIPGIAWQSAKDLALIRQDKKLEGRLLEEIKKFKPDFIYERANTLQLSGIHAAKKSSVPHVLEINAPHSEERYELEGHSFIEKIAAKIESEQLHQTDKVVTVSQTLKDHFLKKYRLSDDHVLVQHNCIDPEKANAGMKSERRTIFENPEAFVVGFVGSIFEWHRVDALISAVSKAQQQVNNICVLVVGSGSILNRLKTQAESELLAGSFHFTGQVSQEAVLGYIRNMSVAAIPNSHWYGSPVKLFEYGAMGVPVIAIGNGPVREILMDNVNGFLTDGTANDLSQKILFCFRSHDLSIAAGQKLQEQILNHHTWDKSAGKIIAEAEKLIARKSRS